MTTSREGRTALLRGAAAIALLALLAAACTPPAEPDAPSEGPPRGGLRQDEPGVGELPWHLRPTTTLPPTTQPTTTAPPSTQPPVTPPPSNDPGAPRGPVGSFQLAFSDDFDGQRLGPAWYPNRWFATTCAEGAGAPEEQYYTSRPQNVSVSGGVLRLTAQRETYTCNEWGGTRRYTSGWVQTGGSRDVGGVNAPPGFTCGVGCFVEARVRMPPGGMTFPAVWMLPVRTSSQDPDARYPERPEIDILEFWEDWRSWEHHIHSTCNGRDVDLGSTFRGPDASAGFHTVGMWWRSPDRLEWYVDGVLTWTYSGCGVPGADERMYIILNHAIGHAAPSPRPDERFPKEMQVDYVRAWHGR